MSIRNIYERVLGPFTSRKGQFVYVDGFPLRNERPVWIVYTKTYKLEMFVDQNEVAVFPRNPKDKTLFSQYKFAKRELKREIYLASFRPVITDLQRTKGTIGRAFARYLLNPHESLIEIDPELMSVPTPMYEKVELKWQISGKKENVKSYNENQLRLANDSLRGMSNLLNPLEFYIEEVTEKQILNRKLEKLLHNPHTYGHQSDASNVGNTLGLSGTHTMPDGSVMPGSSHEEYLRALRQNEEITTSTGTTISTQNLRGSSGY